MYNTFYGLGAEKSTDELRVLPGCEVKRVMGGGLNIKCDGVFITYDEYKRRLLLAPPPAAPKKPKKFGAGGVILSALALFLLGG